MDLKEYIRSIKDYPKKGILFRDITTLIKNEKAFANSIDQSNCTLKAQVKVRMTGYAERRDDYTEQDDIRLAKNAAVKQGGNTIYRIDHPEDGKGTQSAVYQIYNCS